MQADEVPEPSAATAALKVVYVRPEPTDRQPLGELVRGPEARLFFAGEAETELAMARQAARPAKSFMVDRQRKKAGWMWVPAMSVFWNSELKGLSS